MIDHVEATVRALPDSYHRKMARFVLAGWRFKHITQQPLGTPRMWTAINTLSGADGLPWILHGFSLLTLIDKVDEFELVLVED